MYFFFFCQELVLRIEITSVLINGACIMRGPTREFASAEGGCICIITKISDVCLLNFNRLCIRAEQLICDLHFYAGKATVFLIAQFY